MSIYHTFGININHSRNAWVLIRDNFLIIMQSLFCHMSRLIMIKLSYKRFILMRYGKRKGGKKNIKSDGISCVIRNLFMTVPLELHPHQGDIIFLAPAGGSNLAGPYPYGVLTLLALLNFTYPNLLENKQHKIVLNFVGTIQRLLFMIVYHRTTAKIT